jgi:hypothetical protein
LTRIIFTVVKRLIGKKKQQAITMSGISPYADTKAGSDPFVLYKIKGSGFRLAGEGSGDATQGDLDDEIEGDGVSLAGAGLGKGTRKKIVKVVGKYGPKVARAGIGLISEFGSPEQKMVAANALVAGRIVHGAGGCGGSTMQGKGVALRRLMN